MVSNCWGLGADLASAIGAAPQAATPAWVTPLIAAGAAILAATVTALASAYAARRKVAELELSNSFEQAKHYLESARKYTQEVYVPLAVAIYKLHDRFLAFKAAAQGGEPESADDSFRTECDAFISTADNMFRNGAAATLTLRLDEAITRFMSFLQESLTTAGTIRARSVALEAALLGFRIASAAVPVVGFGPIGPSLLADDLNTYLSLPGLGLFRSRFRSLIVAAPIRSEDFEKQFIFYVNTIKAGIKEVTLGAYKVEEK